MPGTNAGTGQPLNFRCYKCRRRHNDFGLYPRGSPGWKSRVKLTGQRRRAPSGRGGLRNSRWRWEYECQDCEHTGWSRHIDLEYKAIHEGLATKLDLNRD